MVQGSSLVDKTSPASSPTQPHALGQMGSKRVVEAKNQTSKAWFILAIVVGSAVLVGAGGFGAVGLLQSHDVISLPQSMQWLSSAIGTIGNTPHFWSLWALTGGALLVSSILMTIGARKIRQTEAIPGINNEKYTWAYFSEDNFNSLFEKEAKNTFTFLKPGTYALAEDKGLIWEDRFMIVIKKKGMPLQSSFRLTLSELKGLEVFLAMQGYKIDETS